MLLLRGAVEQVSADAQALLRAIAVCAPEGVWLSFAAEVARLDSERASNVAEELADSSLLRLLDREEQRFSIHATLREVLGEAQELPVAPGSLVPAF